MYAVGDIVKNKEILEVIRVPRVEKNGKIHPRIKYKVKCLNCGNEYIIDSASIAKKGDTGTCKNCFEKPRLEKYKIGDVVKGKKIHDIRHYKVNGQLCREYLVECLNCHEIRTYCNTDSLEKSKDGYCHHCEKSYNINGKIYYTLEDIAKDYNTTFKNVSQHLINNGNLDGLGKVGFASPNFGDNPKSIKVEYNGKTYKTQTALAKELGVSQTTVSQAYRAHDGDVSQVGTGHNSLYKTPATYKVGDIVNGREIIAGSHRYLDEEGKEHNWLYKTKCLKCGHIATVHTIEDLETFECSNCTNIKAPTAVILKEISNKGRKYNLPKNVHYDKRNDTYSAAVASTHERYGPKVTFRETFKTPEECQEILPDLKKLALHYKKTGNYISYGEYLKMGCPELEI